MHSPDSPHTVPCRELDDFCYIPFFFFLGPKENGTESRCMHARRGMSDEDWDRVRRVFIRCVEVSQSRLIYMLISEQTTTLNELILICTLTYELTQLLSRIYISLKPGEFEYVSHFQVWTAHELDLLLFFPHQLWDSKGRITRVI